MSQYGLCECGNELRRYCTKIEPVIACCKCQKTVMSLKQWRWDEAKKACDDVGIGCELIGERPEFVEQNYCTAQRGVIV